MNERKKNRARLEYKGQEFAIYQDNKNNWCFSYLHLMDVCTQHKELQPALNEVHSTIEDLMPRRKGELAATHRKSRKRGRGKFPPKRKFHESKN